MANDLAELVQLLQLSNLSQQPQLEQQRLQQQNHAANVESMLQLLGLQQQGQHQQDQLGFERSQAQQNLAHQTAQESQAQANTQKGLDLEGLKLLGQETQGGQKLNPLLEAALRGSSPMMDQSLSDYHTNRAVQQYQQGQQGYNAVYAKHDPAALAAYSALQGFEPDAQTWLQQNAQSQPPAAPAQHWYNNMGGTGATNPQNPVPQIPNDPQANTPGNYGAAFGSALSDKGAQVADLLSTLRNHSTVPTWNFLAGATGLPQQQPIPSLRSYTPTPTNP